MGMCKIWSSPGAFGPVGETRLSAKYLREHGKAGQLPAAGLAREDGFLGGEHTGPSRPVELGLMFETVKSFWLQAVPPASLSWHLESSVFEKNTPVVHPSRWRPMAAASSRLSPCHQPLPLPGPGFPVTSQSGPHFLPCSPLTGLVHPLRPWHPLFLLSGRPFSSLSPW